MSKTSRKTSPEKEENKQKNHETIPNTAQNPLENTQKPMIPIIPHVPVMSEDVSSPSEVDLRKEQEKTKKMLLARELLTAGYSVRDVVRELKLSKSLIEKLSKKMNREPSKSHARAEYLDRPFKKALEEVDADESLLSTGWFERTYRRLLRMRIEFKMMQNMGLLGEPDGKTSHKTQQIDVNGLLFAKAISGSGNKEILELLGTLKTMGVLQPQQAQDAMEQYARFKTLETQAIQQHSQLEQAAYARAKSDANQGIVKQAVEKAVEIGSQLIHPPPNIPIPSPMNAVPVKPTTLENLTLEGVEITPTAKPLKAQLLSDDVGVGYSNLTAHKIQHLRDS